MGVFVIYFVSLLILVAAGKLFATNMKEWTIGVFLGSAIAVLLEVM